MSNKQVFFRGGIPYGPDRRRLEEAFPVPELTEGRVIKHEEIAELLQCERGSHRYYGVLNSWIARLRNEYGVIVAFEKQVGVKVLDPASILAHRETACRSAGRQVGRAWRRFVADNKPDRLDDTGRARYDHITRSMSVLAASAEQAKKQMAIELAPVQSLPKPQLTSRRSA